MMASNVVIILRRLFRLRYRQDGALDFSLDLRALVNRHMINADVAAEIDVRQLTTITGIRSYGGTPAR